MKSLPPFLNSKRARSLSLLINSGKVSTVKFPGRIKTTARVQSLSRFTRFLNIETLKNKHEFKFGKRSKPFSLVGAPTMFRHTLFVPASYSNLGFKRPRRFFLKKEFFKRRALEVLSRDLTRFLSAYRKLPRAAKRSASIKGLPKSLLNALQDYESTSNKLKLRLLRSKKRSVFIRPKTELLLSRFETTPRSRRRRTKTISALQSFFLRRHVQAYIYLAYEDFPKTISPRLRDFTETSYEKPLIVLMSSLSSFAAYFGKWVLLWTRLVFSYVVFSTLPPIELYLIEKNAKRVDNCYYLRFRFNRLKLVISLTDKATQKTHVFISPGLFLKHFQKKKSLKKSRSMKVLMARFMRKVLIILKLKDVLLHSRGVPLHLEYLLSVLFRPFSHPFYDPISEITVNEVDDHHNINVSGIWMESVRPYGFQKTRKMGRVKRKIRRRITRLGNVID